MTLRRAGGLFEAKPLDEPARLHLALAAVPLDRVSSASAAARLARVPGHA